MSIFYKFYFLRYPPQQESSPDLRFNIFFGRHDVPRRDSGGGPGAPLPPPAPGLVKARAGEDNSPGLTINNPRPEVRF